MFAKFLLTVAVVLLIWFGFKYLSRLAELKHGGKGAVPRQPRVDAPPRRDEADGVQDMVRCPSCSTWQPARATRPCGRADCPY
jgi:hypothetical protein